MGCEPATDEFLISLFPQLVVTAPEKWLVTVVSAQVGTYQVNMGATEFPVDAELADTISTIRDKLQFALGGQLQAAVSPVGVSSLYLDELGIEGLDITVAGPVDGSITAQLISGGDSNEAFRLLWLANTLCFLPPCCVFACCPSDYTLMHAAIAAHYLFTMGNLSSTGSAANDFQSMRLGPASLSKGANAWAGQFPSDGDLAKTAPGQLYLAIRSKYVFGILCV